MLALGMRLSHPAVKPRHLHTLLHWLKVHTDLAASVRGQAGMDINLRSLYRMPTMHVDMDEAELEDSAARTSMAQLLSACCESSYTKELVGRLVDVSGVWGGGARLNVDSVHTCVRNRPSALCAETVCTTARYGASFHKASTMVEQVQKACTCTCRPCRGVSCPIESPPPHACMQAALAEAQLVAWLASIRSRVQAVPLHYSGQRYFGAFTVTNISEVRCTPPQRTGSVACACLHTCLYVLAEAAARGRSSSLAGQLTLQIECPPPT